MGQYYKIIILSDVKHTPEVIRVWICPSTYRTESHSCGLKLVEHSYINSRPLKAIEELISPVGIFYKCRIVWAGDYADKEESTQKNLYHMVNEDKPFYYPPGETKYRYLVNHTKKEYVDMDKVPNSIHPLPLLVSEGNGRGGGDYDGNNKELCGKWARDIISFDDNISDDYTELIPHFRY